MEDKLIEAIKSILIKYGVNDEELQKSFINDLEIEMNGENGEKTDDETKEEPKEPEKAEDDKSTYDMWKKKIGANY
ncbi:MAG: hypothetical protein M0R51_14975 [Clostridia bacterium]|jgi:hypothetical protein|nr:hypothetical protein [Clostridia bacterium]